MAALIVHEMPLPAVRVVPAVMPFPESTMPRKIVPLETTPEVSVVLEPDVDAAKTALPVAPPLNVGQ